MTIANLCLLLSCNTKKGYLLDVDLPLKSRLEY